MTSSATSLESAAIRALLEEIVNSPAPVATSLAAHKLRSELTASDAQKLYTTLARRVISEPQNALELSKVLVAISGVLTAEARLHLCKSVAVVLKNSPANAVFTLFSELAITTIEEAKTLLAAVATENAKHKFSFVCESVLPRTLLLPLSEADFGLLLTRVVPELVSGLSETSNESRVVCTVALKLLTRYAMENKNFPRFLALVVAGLGSESGDFQAGAVIALSVVVPVSEEILSPHDFSEVVTTVIKVSLATPQLVRALIKFLRAVIKLKTATIPNPSTGRPALEVAGEFVGQSLLNSEAAQGPCRMNVRRLVTKLGRKLTWPKLLAVTAAAHASLVRYCQRMSNREIRDMLSRKAERLASGPSGPVPGRRGAGASAADSSDSSDSEDELVARFHHKKPTTAALGKFDVRKSFAEAEAAASAKRGKSLADLKQLREKKNQKKLRGEREATGGRAHDFVGDEAVHKRGDAKKKTKKLQPFAYVRLNPSLAKEKHKKLAVRSFKKVFHK